MDIGNSPSPWAAKTTVEALIKHFPLPMALLDNAGDVSFLNERFKQTYRSDVFELRPIRDLVQSEASEWETIAISLNGQECSVLARAFRVGENKLVILDKAPDDSLRLEIEQLQKEISRLETLSAVDTLTGVWNRAHFNKMVPLEMARCSRLKHPVTLIIADIDHFKQINDSLGHLAGDSLLCELVEVISSCIRATDMLFRWGGEEFAILAIATGYRTGFGLAERIRNSVEKHNFPSIGKITISLGVAEHLGTEAPPLWFHRADQALYQAKDGGRNRSYVDHRGNSDVWAAEKGPSVIRLDWQEAYECGEPTIDQEHHALFDLGNKLLDAAFTAETAPENFSSLLDRLLAHIAMHFRDEELILQNRGFNELAAHKRIHAALLLRAEELKNDVASGKVTLGDLVDFIANTVIAQHIFKEDQKYFSLFSKTIPDACSLD
jgi:diguanylate cyclase (GGDEF)-like protein/hemerythrin-like metal-binding protein